MKTAFKYELLHMRSKEKWENWPALIPRKIIPIINNTDHYHIDIAWHYKKKLTRQLNKIPYKSKKINSGRTYKHKYTRFVFRRIIICFILSYFRKFELEILKPKSKLWWKNRINKDNRFNAELLKGSHRKKNKLTWTYIFRFFIFRFSYMKSKILKKCEYRKILKNMGVLG